MSKLEFKPEDFHFPITMDTNYISDRAAVLANEKLQKLIESWPVVYFSSHNALGELKGSAGLIIGTKQNGDTHSARLAFIEEIKKECPGHEPGYFSNGCILHLKQGGSMSELIIHCKHCRVELQATWSEKK